MTTQILPQAARLLGKPEDPTIMNFDLRLPLGLLFTLFGAILSIFGAVSDPKIYEKSLGININLVWGAVMLVFGLLMLVLAIKGRKNDR